MSQQEMVPTQQAPTLSVEQFLAVIDHSDSIVYAIGLAQGIGSWLEGRKLVTQADYLEAAERLQSIKSAQAACEATRTSVTGPLNDLLRKINAQVALAADPLGWNDARTKEKGGHEHTIKGLMLAYDQEQERKRREAQAIADAAAAVARKKAEEGAAAARAVSEAAAKKLRDEAEALRQAGNVKQAAKLEVRAEATVEAGEQKAQTSLFQAATTVAPIAPTTTVRVAGIARKMVWKYKVVNPLAVKRDYLMLDDPLIGKMVKQLGKRAEDIIGGIECYEEPDIASGKRK